MYSSDSILQVSPVDPRWIAFLNHSVDINVFYHPAWMQLMTETYGYRAFILALADTDGSLVAGIPVMEINNPLKGRRWVSLPFSDSCRPLSRDEAILNVFTEQILQLVESQGISALELRGTYPVHPSLQKQSDHVIHKLDLTSGLDAVWKGIHAMHRRNIRIATKNGIEIIRGVTKEHLTDFYHLHLLTRRSQGVPIQPWKFFLHLKELLLDQGHGSLLLAYKNQRCVAGAVLLYWKDTFTFKYGASRDDSLNDRPNNLIMWTAIQQACEQGFQYFDMGRSNLDNQGLRNFKSRWGAEEMPLYYTSFQTDSRVAVEVRLSRLMHFVIRRSPAWVCRLTGELLYGYFG
jgi:hypothetical protein